MTKKRLGLVLLGLVLLVAGLVVGANMQAPAAQEAFRGHFRIRIDDKGVLSCWRDTSGTPCPAKVVPKESLAAATMTSIIVIKANPCYIYHNGVFYDVPCF